MNDVNQLISGAILMGYVVAGLFFWRFWRQTQDRLFAIFAVSFWMLGVQRLAVAMTTEVMENRVWLYGIRLLAYVLILAAIIDKNRSSRPG